MSQSPSNSPPPWHDDPCPEAWVELAVAARIYYRRNATHLRSLALKGRLAERVAMYANRYWIRLPENPAILRKLPQTSAR